MTRGPRSTRTPESSQGSPLDVRSSGILLHVSSLPGPHGHGDLGPPALAFADFLKQAGQGWWQMLPIGPVGGGFSPYDSASAFAGNPEFVSLELLHRDGLLRDDEIRAPRSLAASKRSRYAAARRFRWPRLELAHARWAERASRPERSEFERFAEDNSWWLDDYALFAALAEREGSGTCWAGWSADLVARRPAALARARARLAERISLHAFLQFEFDRQWKALKAYCSHRNVLLLGDVPMFVAYGAADVWGHQDLFQLDARGHRQALAGVPPDYFSRTGQLWGNPLYRWEVLERTGFDWWLRRFRKVLDRFDALRLDHFIGFHRCWEVPARARSARRGRFRLVPGRALLSLARAALGGVPFLAEDLGLVTEEVRALRDAFELPGMRVLQFGFSEGAEVYEPHRFPRRSVVYTGTHDNDTLMGWLGARPPPGVEKRAFLAQRKRALDYVGAGTRERHWDFIRIALMSVANTAIFPLQDILGLGSRARMNVPGTPAGNWSWRVGSAELTIPIAERLAQMCSLYERLPSQRTVVSD